LGSNSEQDARFGQLMAQAQKGDSDAYRVLLTEVCEILKGFVRNRLPDNNSVDEVVQEILLSLHQARHSYNPSRPFKPWMFAIARYRLIDYLRSWGRTKKQEVDGHGLFESMTATPVELNSDRGVQLAEAMAGLPVKQREMIEMLKFEGLSIRDVARKMDMSEGAVKVAAHRAYNAIRKHFGIR